MAQNYFVVCLKQNRFVILKESWVQNPYIQQFSMVFFSPNDEAMADFGAEKKFYFNPNASFCYDGFVTKAFANIDDAQNYISWKRPQFPNQVGNQLQNRFSFVQQQIVEEIIVSDEGIICLVLFSTIEIACESM